MILVTGATGMFGGLVARGLVRAGHPVRALVRDPAKAQALEVAGTDLAVADMDRLAASAGGIRAGPAE